MPAAWKLLDGGMVAEGAYKNLSYLSPKIAFADNIPDEMRLMLADPQTSGGLLIAVPEPAQQLFENAGVFHAVIGTVTQGTGRIHIGK